jgi:CRP/FNR family transcriptional regulator, nitrogen fixation regulation protein
MYQHNLAHSRDGILEQSPSARAAVSRSGELDAFLALEQIRTRRSFSRDQEIFAEGDSADCWFKIVSGTVRTCKWMADGRRHILEFCFIGDCFGLSDARIRAATAEAVGDVIVMRYPQSAADRLIDKTPRLAREMYDRTLRELAQAQTRMLLLGRMTASERVASFLLEIAERCDTPLRLDVPMSRSDVADYLGLTIETVCRTLSAFKHERHHRGPDATADRAAKSRRATRPLRGVSLLAARRLN